MQTLTITTPDDWHLHLRDGAPLRDVVGDSARQFGRALVMPNLRPPVTTVAEALAYRQRILDVMPEGSEFLPLMTLYLNDQTTAEEIRRVADEPGILACKLYPAGATTNSDAGVTRLEGIYPVLEAMQRHEVPLLVHGEVTDGSTDIFDREKLFIDRYLMAMVKSFPSLKVVLEHVTTQEGVAFVRESREGIAATITAHHLLFNRNAMLAGGIRPHFYCLPILKRDEHRQALLDAATSGNARFFLGTDSAPHPRIQKDSACGCAGCYTAHAAMELYTMAFESRNALDKLEAFASFNGPAFYGLPKNTGTLTLQKESWDVPDQFSFGEGELIPLMAGEQLPWRVIATGK